MIQFFCPALERAAHSNPLLKHFLAVPLPFCFSCFLASTAFLHQWRLNMNYYPLWQDRKELSGRSISVPQASPWEYHRVKFSSLWQSEICYRDERSLSPQSQSLDKKACWTVSLNGIVKFWYHNNGTAGHHLSQSKRCSSHSHCKVRKGTSNIKNGDWD